MIGSAGLQASPGRPRADLKVGATGGRDLTNMATLRIEGGRRLSGRIAVEGNKNSALPLIAACLLTDQECVLTNVPRIRDVDVLVDLMVGLGATVEGVGTSTLRVRCETITSDRPDPVLVGKLRGSVLLLGPLLARKGSARLAQPGGDFPGAAHDRDAPAGAHGDGRRRARRARPRARSAERADGRVVLPRRSVGDRHRDGAARRRRGEGPYRDPPCGDGAARRRALPLPAGDGRLDRRRGDVDDSRRSARAVRGRAASARRRLHRGRQLGRRRRDHRRRHRGDRRPHAGPRGRRRAAPRHGPALRLRRRSAAGRVRRR